MIGINPEFDSYTRENPILKMFAMAQMAQFKSTMRISAVPKLRNIHVDLSEKLSQANFSDMKRMRCLLDLKLFRSEILGKDDGS